MINALLPTFTVRQGATTISIYHADKGQGLPKHSHEFSHLSMCHAGRVVVRKENRFLELVKTTQPVNLIAGEWHEIEALEANTIFVNIAITP